MFLNEVKRQLSTTRAILQEKKQNKTKQKNKKKNLLGQPDIIPGHSAEFLKLIFTFNT